MEAAEMQDPAEEGPMRKVIVSEFASLDGVIENPVWTFRFTGERKGEDETRQIDGISQGPGYG